jgi:methylmalonyl-CoA mutase
MIGLKEIFGDVSFDQWITRLKKDLRSEDLHELEHFDEIEGITYSSVHHHSNSNFKDENPGVFPFTRGSGRENNHWSNESTIVVNDCDEANKIALDALMNGIDAIDFDLANTSLNLEKLLEKIEIQFIRVNFNVQTIEQFREVHNKVGTKFQQNCSMSIDMHKGTLYSSQLPEISSSLKNKQYPVFLADGFSIQQCGASITQEISFVLATAHEYLFQLLQQGLTIDEAAACIHFRIGIGSNYFMEIAKIRSIRKLWSFIIKQYSPEHNCSYNCRITAKSGLLNKSAQDPYTNLLRQTTEAMSAVSGGIDTINVVPYDDSTSNGTSSLSVRMARNISLILKEESYFDKVIDPAGGSYAVESLTGVFSENSWKEFKKIESAGGISNLEVMNDIKMKVTETAGKRLSQVRNAGKTMIGINKFPNIQKVENKFNSKGNYIGLPFLIIERDI